MSNFSGTGRSSKALITLEQVNTSVVTKKEDLHEQNFDGKANRSGELSLYANESSNEHAIYFPR